VPVFFSQSARTQAEWQGGDIMECIRCQGLMVEDQFFDFEGTQGFMWMKGWRCMNCGHAVDPVIEANHRLHDATVLVLSPEELEKANEYVCLRAEPVTRVAA
jgi:hypothetical protein